MWTLKISHWDGWRFDSKVGAHEHTQLQLLEGLGVQINKPQNSFKDHTIWRGSSPFLFIGRLDNLHTPKACVTPGDLQMLQKRLAVLRYTVPLENRDMGIPTCASCFSKFVLAKGNRPCLRFQTPDLQFQDEDLTYV